VGRSGAFSQPSPLPPACATVFTLVLLVTAVYAAERGCLLGVQGHRPIPALPRAGAKYVANITPGTGNGLACYGYAVPPAVQYIDFKAGPGEYLIVRTVETWG